jgi:hypothetical protein
MVLTKDLAAKILQRNLSQLILNVSLNQNSQQQEQTQPNNNSISTLTIELPSSFDVMEAVLPENVSPSFYLVRIVDISARTLILFESAFF